MKAGKLLTELTLNTHYHISINHKKYKKFNTINKSWYIAIKFSNRNFLYIILFFLKKKLIITFCYSYIR